MASTLYLQLPPKVVADRLGALDQQVVAYCQASADKNILQQGRDSLSAIQKNVSGVDDLVLLVSASDVNFIEVAVPPMPFAKLKAALPNLLEEQLLSDPTDLLFVPSQPVNGKCTVAVVAKSWMEQLLLVGTAFAARKVSAYAVSDCLGHATEFSTVLVEMVVADNLTCEISVKGDSQIRLGLSIDSQGKELSERDFANQIYAAVNILVPQQNLQCYVPIELESSLRQLISNDDSNDGVTQRQIQFHRPDWKNKIAKVSNQTIDLFSTLHVEGKHSVDWLKWRWTIILLVTMLLISLLALNWQWMSLRREANTIRDSIQAIYQTTFPKEPVSRDPVFQMQQKINLAKKMSGQSGNDDFLVLSAQFAAAWGQLVPAQASATVNSIEYRERSLFITPKNPAEFPVDQLTTLLKERGLKLDVKEGVLKLTVDMGGVR